MLAPNASQWISRQYKQFAGSAVAPAAGPARGRLTSASNNGRLELWRVAWHGFEAERLRGSGAGSYVLLWQRNRPIYEMNRAGRAFALPADSCRARRPRSDRADHVPARAAARSRFTDAHPARTSAGRACRGHLIAWALHSAIDWDWQMPVVMVPILALVAAVGASSRPGSASAPSLPARGLVGICCLAFSLAPALVAVSQAELDASVRSFERSDCRTAVARARRPSRAVSPAAAIEADCRRAGGDLREPGRRGRGHRSCSSGSRFTHSQPADRGG